MKTHYKTIQNKVGSRLVALCMLSALLLSAYRVPKTTVAQEASAARRKPVVSEDTYTDSEPNLKIEFTSVELTVGTITSAIEPSMPFSLSTAGLGGPASKIVATFEKHDIEGQPQIVSSSTSVNASVEAVDSTFKLTLTLAENTTSETREVVVIRINVEGRNGRTNSKQVRVFVNSGGFVGQILPSPVIEGSSDAFQVKLQSSRFTTNKYEGSILYVDLNANGNHDAGEPITTVDADNQFHFPNPKAFYYEHLIRPLSLVVDEKTIDPAKFTTYLLDEEKPWFKIGPADEDDGGGEGPVPGPPDPFEVGNAVGLARSGGDSAALREPEKNTTELTDNEEAEPHAVEANEDDGAIKFFVDSRVAASGNGTAWPQAFKTLQKALKNAKTLIDGDETVRVRIYVVDGVYTAVPEGFSIPKNVSLYGGFTGSEVGDDLVTQRPRIKRGTILSGDIDHNDGHFAPVVATAISPDGKFIATASEDRTIKIWKSEDRTLAATLYGHLQSVICLNFAPTVSDSLTDEAYRLVSGGKDMTVRLWHLNDSGGPLKTSRILVEVESQQFSHYGTVLGVSISPNGNRIASASEDATIGMWDISDPHAPRLVSRLRGHEGAVNCVDFVDDSTIASGGDDKTVRTWLDSGGAWRGSELLTNHTDRVTQLAIIQSGATFASGSDDASIRIWTKVGSSFQPGPNSPLRHTMVESVVPTLGPVTGLVNAPDQRSLVSSHLADDGVRLGVWQVETGQLNSVRLILTEPELEDGVPISDIAVPAQTDEQQQNYWIVGGRADGTSSIWPLIPLESEYAGQTSVAAISPNGLRLATVKGKTVKLRTVGDDNAVDDLAHDDAVSALCFSRTGPKSTHLATGSATMLRWLNLADPTAPAPPRDTSHHINCIAVSVDDVWLATGGEDKVVKVWKAGDLAADPIEFGGHLQAITAVSFVGKGENAKVISASADGTIKIWNLKKAQIETTIDAGISIADMTVTGTEGDLTVFAAQSVDKYDDVRLRSTQPLRLNGVSGVVVDGVQVKVNDRILVSGQKDEDIQNGKGNGIWVVKAGQWDLVADEFTVAKHVLVTEGLAYAGRLAKYTGPAGATPGTEEITFADSTGTVAAWHWNAENETLTALDAIPAYFLNELEFASDGQTLVAGSKDGSLSVWKRDNSAKLRRIKVIPTVAPINTVSVSADGDRILTASNGTVRVWDQSPIGELTQLRSFSPAGDENNVKSVVVIAENVTNVTLDGFVIKGGSSTDTDGGAIHIEKNAGAGDEANRIVINSCVLEANRATNGGAIDIAHGAVVDVNQCYFSYNMTRGSGGAIHNQGSLGLDSSVFLFNSASNGGAVAINTNANMRSLQLCTISNCSATNGNAILSKSNLRIEHSTIAGSADGSPIAVENPGRLSIRNSVVTAPGDVSAFLGDAKVFDDSSSNCLLPKKTIEISSVRERVSSGDLYFYSCGASTWEKKQPVSIGTVVRSKGLTSGMVFLCREADAGAITGLEPPDWPDRINEDVVEEVDGKKITWRSVFDLSVAPLFAEFGDHGGLHETLPLASNSVARDIGSNASNLNWDQRGENYTRNYGMPDIGAFEWLPLPNSHADSYAYDNSQTDFESLGDPLENDALPRLNSTLVIADRALADENPTKHFQNVRLVATDDLGPQPSGVKVIDGVPTQEGDRVLLVRQGGAVPSPQNGIFVVHHPSVGNPTGKWKRASDADNAREMLKYKTVKVSAGNSFSGTTWTLTYDELVPIPVLNTTKLAFDNSSTPTTFGQAKIAEGQLQYRLKPEFHKTGTKGTGFLGREEINYVSHFGDLVSAPARATVWIVSPAEIVNSADVHRFVVNSTADHPIDSGPINFNEGGLTLREAMLLAEHTDGDDEIYFEKTVFSEPRVIDLVEPLVFSQGAKGSLAIVGPGADKLAIRAGTGKTPGHRGLEVYSMQAKSPRFTISHLSFRACEGQDSDGGAVYIMSDTTISIECVAFVGNKAKDGAAIFSDNEVKVKVSQCTFTENDALDDDGRTVLISGESKVTGSVFWQNRTKGQSNEPNDEKSIYGEINQNYYQDPRFVRTPTSSNFMESDIRLRRDSLAFRHGANLWTPEMSVRLKMLVRPEGADESTAFECIAVGTGKTNEHPPDQKEWPAEIGQSFKEKTGVEWRRVEEDLRTFRFLGAYPKLPRDPDVQSSDSDVPFGSMELYVDKWVRNPGNGGAWKSALPSLAEAIEVAATDYRIRAIKIAGDEDALEDYKPMRPYAMTTSDDSAGVDPDWTFILQHGLKLEGGYPSAKTFHVATEDDRDSNLLSNPDRYETILSGQLTSEANSNHVLTALGIRGFEISRLTVANGNGNEPGGGLWTGQPETHALGSVNGVFFESNKGMSGGAIHIDGASLRIIQSSFLGNEGTLEGGAISVVNEGAKLRISNSTFLENVAPNGGAIHVAEGNIAIDHVTIARNEATVAGGIAGLFVDEAVHNVTSISDNIIAENNNNGTRSDSNRDEDLPPSNVITPEWGHSLLGQFRYNAFQIDEETRNGPTKTVAILPQIPFRMGPSTQQLTQLSEPRSLEMDDQRGALGVSLSKSDAGAFERQYFIHEQSMTRFFIVHDDHTGRQLWAEVVDRGDAVAWTKGMSVSLHQLVFAPNSDMALLFECSVAGMGLTGTEPPEWPTASGETASDANGIVWTAIVPRTAYVQVSQHVGDNPIVQPQSGGGFAVAEDAIDFRIGSKMLTATETKDGFVQPSSLFPFADHAIGVITVRSTESVSRIKLDVSDSEITLVDKSGMKATSWKVQREGSNTSSSKPQISNPQLGTYRAVLFESSTAVEAIEFEVSEKDTD